jgi:hypothetical protein
MQIALQTDAVDTGFDPREWQARVGDALTRFSVVVVHRRGGKTVFAINKLIDEALREHRTSPRFAYFAPFLKQARAIAWDYLKFYTRNIPGVTIHESDLSVDFPNGARIRLFGADNILAAKGLYFDGVVLDEVAQMDPTTWGEVVRPALADRNGWALFIGTPRGINLFSELFHRAQADVTGEWSAFLLRPEDTNALDPVEIEKMQAEMSESEFAQEILCDFSAANTDNLIGLALALEASKRSLRQDQFMYAPRVMGVDVARYGDDRCCIFARQGLAAFQPRVFRDIDNMDFAAKVAASIDKFKPDAVFVDAGRGEGVIDRLRQLGYSVVEVPFGGKPLNDRFADKRSEMWSEMEKWLRAGGALPNSTDLIQDLCAPTYTYADRSGKFRLESKDSMRERGMRSPDLADALALTFAAPIRKDHAPDAWKREGKTKFADMAYDPFKEER